MGTNFKLQRNQQDTYVSDRSREKTRDGNTVHSTDPCNMQEDVCVRKRKDGDDGQMPRKRVRFRSLTNCSKHSQVSLEEIKIQRGKRKASVDIHTPRKKPPVKPKKRKANNDSRGPGKMMRYDTCIICHESGTTESISSEDDGGDVSLILNNVSPEEEKIYQLASSGNTSLADFDRKYVHCAPIGVGGFASVYAGYRKQDRLKVAIKYIPRKKVLLKRVVCNGNVYFIILEVALMLKTAGLPGSVGQSAVVSLLDWYIFEQELVMVMERPVPSKDLFKYLKDHRGSLEGHEAKKILRQLVDAAISMHSQGVFHRDIKTKNVLVELNKGEPRVRIIDFGCGTFSKKSSYSTFCGTLSYFPPEWFKKKKYWACSTTVWQLGALFYSLLKGHGRFRTIDFLTGHVQISPALSTDCKTLLNLCLARDPTERATLEELQLCSALRETSPAPTTAL